MGRKGEGEVEGNKRRTEVAGKKGKERHYGKMEGRGMKVGKKGGEEGERKKETRRKRVRRKGKD